MHDSARYWSSAHAMATDPPKSRRRDIWRRWRGRERGPEPRPDGSPLFSPGGIRRDIVPAPFTAQASGHIGGDLSVTDILAAAYWGVAEGRSARSRSPRKGPVRAVQGALRRRTLFGAHLARFFPRGGSTPSRSRCLQLNGHPNRMKVPGVETNTGPLGHGFPVAAGPPSARSCRAALRTFVVIGDGELQEGSNWEAAMTAGHYGLPPHRDRRPQPPAAGRPHRGDQGARSAGATSGELRLGRGDRRPRLRGAARRLSASTTGKPVAIIANTFKGKGVSFMEDRVEWHHKVPSARTGRLALEELSA